MINFIYLIILDIGDDQNMKLHFKGKYNQNPESLPCGRHMEGAVKFKEPEDTKRLSFTANILSLVFLLMMAISVIIRCAPYLGQSLWQLILGLMSPLVIMLPHEITCGMFQR